MQRYRLWLWGPGLGRTYTSNEKYMCWGDNSWCNNEGYHFCPYWSCVSWATWHMTSFKKGTTIPNCSQGTCNPIHFTVLKPSDWTQGQIISIRTDGQGFDPGTPLHLKLTIITHESSHTRSSTTFMRKCQINSPFLLQLKTCSSHWLNL
jgi:hypothetical protein